MMKISILKFKFYLTVTILLLSVFSTPVSASKASGMTSLIQAGCKKLGMALSKKGSLTTHTLDHWKTITSKVNHTVFKISQQEAREFASKELTKRATWTFKGKTDDVIEGMMSRQVDNIKLAGGKSSLTYLSYNAEKGAYDLVVEQFYKNAGTRGESIIKIVMNPTTGELITMYPKRSLTNLSKYRHTSYGIGAGFFISSQSDLTTQLAEYENYQADQCNCEKKEPDEFSAIQFAVDMLLPLGFGTSEANPGEAEYIQWRNFLYYEFDRRINNLYEQCDKENEELGIQESCAPFTENELEDLFKEFEEGMNASIQM